MDELTTHDNHLPMVTPINKVVVLDRDGVINKDSDQFVKSVDEWIPIDGSIEAIAQLNKAGFWVAIASNQSGIGRGYFDYATVDAMHDKLADLLSAHNGHIDAIAICPHAPDDGCDCRKPLPGLLEQLRDMAGHELAGGFIIGDSLRDLQAGVAAGMHPILVRTGKGQTVAMEDLPAGTKIFDDLASAAQALCTQETV